jgi:hypothetical protein
VNWDLGWDLDLLGGKMDGKSGLRVAICDCDYGLYNIIINDNEISVRSCQQSLFFPKLCVFLPLLVLGTKIWNLKGQGCKMRGIICSLEAYTIVPIDFVLRVCLFTTFT